MHRTPYGIEMPQYSAPPRVSIGLPVFNGAACLAETLESLVGQTLRELELIISDNASTDATPEICRRFAEQDPRIRYFRQPVTVPVTDNFIFVLAQAKAPYFMWAAHDDLRDPDFVERLAAALDENDDAILAFGDVVEIVDGMPRSLPLRFANGELSARARLRNAALLQLHNLYGLWRTERLRAIRWRHNDWWHDTPPMMAAAMLGEFVHVPGVLFRYQYNRHPFFDWPRRPGISGLLFDAAQCGRRLADLARLVWLSAITVGEVAGFGYGLLAGWFALRKVAGQIGGYIMRSRRNTLAADQVELFEYEGYRIPIDLVNLTGAGIDSFDVIAKAHISQLEQSVGLSSHHHILEIGSGIGRDAIQLAKLLTQGSYTGVDIIKRSIDWCCENITPRFQNFHFVHYDVQDQLHNPGGTTQTRMIHLPIESASIDRIILWSVLTHMFEGDIEHYFREFRRVLKPDGLVFATCFLFNEEILASAQAHNITPYDLRFPYDYGGGCRINNSQFPAGAVAYTIAAMEKMIRESGLVLAQPFSYRNWSGYFDAPVGQDFMVLRLP